MDHEITTRRAGASVDAERWGRVVDHFHVKRSADRVLSMSNDHHLVRPRARVLLRSIPSRSVGSPRPRVVQVSRPTLSRSVGSPDSESFSLIASTPESFSRVPDPESFRPTPSPESRVPESDRTTPESPSQIAVCPTLRR